MQKRAVDHQKAEAIKLIATLPSYPLESLPAISAVCFCLDDDGECLYISSSVNISKAEFVKRIQAKTAGEVACVAVLPVEVHLHASSLGAEAIKALMIEALQPRYNDVRLLRRALLRTLRIEEGADLQKLVEALATSANPVPNVLREGS
jgi:hypothetical protein